MPRFLKDARRWLPGAIISVLVVAAILYFVDLRSLADAIRRADIRWLLLSILLSVIWLAVRALVWRTLLREQATYGQVFLTLNEGYLLNNFLPFRVGEIGRAFLLSRKTGLAFMQILPTIVIERVLDLAFAALILLCAVPFAVGASSAGRIAWVAGGLVAAGLVVLYLLAHNHIWAMGVFDRTSIRWPALQRLGGSFLQSFFAGLAVLTDSWLFLRFLALMALDWAIAIVQFLILLLAFFPKAQLIWAMFALGAAAFGGAVPSLPGAVGTFEGAMGGALALVTSDRAGSLAAALVTHLLNYLVTGAIGIYALSSEGQTLSGIYKQLIRLRSKPDPNGIAPGN